MSDSKSKRNELKMVNIVEAKREYMKELNSKLTRPLYAFFKTLYSNVAILSDKGREYYDFQKSLRALARWNETTVDKTVGELLAAIGCDYLEDLIKITVVNNAKILMLEHSVSEREILSRADLRDQKDFIYKCLVECSRQLYNSPFLFAGKGPAVEGDDSGDSYEKIKAAIERAIEETLRGVLPIKDIVGNMFQVEESSSYDDSVSEPSSKESDAPADDKEYIFDQLTDDDIANPAEIEAPTKRVTIQDPKDDIDDDEPEPVAEAEPAAEPAAEPTAEPTTEPTAEPATEPATEPTTEPMVEQKPEPSAKVASESEIKSISVLKEHLTPYDAKRIEAKESLMDDVAEYASNE